jgi:CBS domain-containing protein
MNLFVKDVMTRQVVWATPSMTVDYVAELFFQHRVGAVPVLDSARQVLGIVSGGDLLRGMKLLGARPHLRWWQKDRASAIETARQYTRSHRLTAADVMTSPAVTVSPELPLFEIVELFERRGIKRAPVVRAGALAGMVSSKDILRVILGWQGGSVAPGREGQQAAQ